MKMMKPKVLNVALYGQSVGTLTKLPDGQILFGFDPAYINNHTRPTLSLSFKDRLGGLITSVRSTQIQLPSFFSNLLPENHLRDYIAKAGHVDPKQEFELLELLGGDLPGAVTALPLEAAAPSKVDADAKHKAYEASVLKFSLAGVQLKFSAIETQSRFTIPAHGVGGSWIVKLPSPSFQNLAENEFSMMTLASQLGIEVPEMKVLPITDIAKLPKAIGKLHGNAFAIKRFDRSATGPIHIEDFAQVFGLSPEDKYDKASYADIAEVIYIEAGSAGLEEFIKRLIFNTLIGNADMHLKNWSMIYPDRRNATIAPAYDFVSTIVYLEDKTMALRYVKKKFMAELSLSLLSYLSSKAKLPERLVLNTAKNTVQQFKEVWDKEKKHLLMSKATLSLIEKHFNRIILVKEIK
jgi:serine/threonine-protein kinase HipA